MEINDFQVDKHNSKLVCLYCLGEFKYYHGMLGYESFQCDTCGIDINDLEPKDYS